MNKKITTTFLLVFMIAMVSAMSIGEYELNQEMQITNYCEAGVCTYVTLQSLEHPNGTVVYPNVNMTKNGQTYNYSFTPDQIGEYTFVTCGDSTIDVCDKDTFDCTFSGQTSYVGINVILLLFFAGILVGVVYLHRNVNYDKWYSRIVSKYKEKNYVKMTMSSVAYNLVKSPFGIYYCVGFPIMIVMTDIIQTYNILSLLGLMETMMYVYAWGAVLVGLMLLGTAQEFIHTILKDVDKIKWGVGNE